MTTQDNSSQNNSSNKEAWSKPEIEILDVKFTETGGGGALTDASNTTSATVAGS